MDVSYINVSTLIGGCPIKRLSNSKLSNTSLLPAQQLNTNVQTDGAEKEFQKYTTDKVKNLFEGLRKETDDIEDNIAIGEAEVLKRDQLAFMMRQHELILANLQAAHATDLQKRKEALEAILAARVERKKAKKEARKSIRSSKRRDQTIQQQKMSADAAARIRESISEKRAAFDALTQYMYDTHEKQRKVIVIYHTLSD